jgi:hypothetical protein
MLDNFLAGFFVNHAKGEELLEDRQRFVEGSAFVMAAYQTGWF